MFPTSSSYLSQHFKSHLLYQKDLLYIGGAECLTEQTLRRRNWRSKLFAY